MAKVLIVDDELRIREMIYKYCTHDGHECAMAADGLEALKLYEKEAFDVVVMDVMMPQMDGFEAFKRMKEIRETHCIFLSALGSEDDRLYGFDLGSDDYVVKPFSPMELMARIRVILRNQDNTSDALVFDGLYIDRSSRIVKVDGQAVYLANKEYELLLYLMENAGRALSRETIISRVWGYEYDSDDRTLDTHMKLLRRDLGAYGQRITTIRGVGYRFEKEL